MDGSNPIAGRAAASQRSRERSRAARPASERGVALLASILILALLAAVTAATLWLTRSELWVAGSARAFLQARYSAEAGVWHALERIAPGTDFAALLAGSGGLVDPDRPGTAAVSGRRLRRLSGTAVRLRRHRARRRDRARAPALERDRGAWRAAHGRRHAWGARRSPTRRRRWSSSPERVTIAPALAGLAPEAGGIAIDAALPAGGTQAVVAGSTADAADAAWTSLAAASARLLGGTPRGRARPFDVTAFARATGVGEQAPSILAADQGAAGAPVGLVLAAGAAPRLAGVGALLVTGALELAGDVAWRGVLLVDGALRVTATSCRIEGMVWAREISFVTGCALRFDPAAVLEADAALRLPRRPTLLALDDS